MSLRLAGLRLRGRIRRPLLRFIERNLLGRGLRGIFHFGGGNEEEDCDGGGGNGAGDGGRGCGRWEEGEEEDGHGGSSGIGGHGHGRFGSGDGSSVGNDRNDRNHIGKNGMNDIGRNDPKERTTKATGTTKKFWQRTPSADSAIGLPDSDSDSNSDKDITSSHTTDPTNFNSLGTAITSGTSLLSSTSFTFAAAGIGSATSSGWRYISLSDSDDYMHNHSGVYSNSTHARVDQDDNVRLLHGSVHGGGGGGMRFRSTARGKNRNRNGKGKGKKVVMFASGIPEEGPEHEDHDDNGKRKGVKRNGKGGKQCEGGGWFETLMVHGLGSIAHLYVPCVDFTAFDDENGLGITGKKEGVVVTRHGQAQAHIVIFDDGLGGIALRDL